MTARALSVSTPTVPVETMPASITHVLNRLSFGIRSGDRDRLQEIGITAYLQDQLNPQKPADPPQLSQRLQSLSTYSIPVLDLFKQHHGLANDIPAQQNLRQQIAKDAMHARLLRALDSPHQLQEVMVDFWFNHFNVFLYKITLPIWIGSYNRDVIRPHAMGTFRDLLGATAKHPAMLLYLDNWRNTDPNSAGAKGAYHGINENYARELMELHTLGVDGGYSQADVEALARILTGWSMVNARQTSLNDYGFFFARHRHDRRSKMFLGTFIPPNDLQEGEQALDLLAAHPSTAHHISFKLAQYFVSDDPPSDVVKDVATEFQATEGNISKVLWRLFTHSDFWADEYRQRKFRTPYQYVMASARSLGLTDPSIKTLDMLRGMLYGLQMPLFLCRSPDGYDQTQEEWLSPNAMLHRINVVNRMAQHYRETGADVEPLMANIHHHFSSHTQAAVQSAPKHLQASLILGSPELMYR